MSDTLKFELSKCDKPTSSVEINRAGVQAIVDEIAELERRLAEAVKERDEAREQADPFVCNSLECGTTPPRKKGDWWTDSEGDEYELRYAAKRGFIERHPERPTWFKFTAAAKGYIR